MINLDYLYDLSYKELELKYGQLYLMNYLYPELKLGKNPSPLRRDNNPSFLISRNVDDSIYWKDMRTMESGNLYTLIINKEPSVTDFRSCISFINRNIRRLEIKPNTKIILPEAKIDKPKFKLGVKRRLWTRKDLDYWNSFGITLETLKKYKVDPIEFIYLNPNTDYEEVIKADEYAYVYKEEKDGIVTLKIYQPFSKTLKWLSDCTEINSSWEGWVQLPKEGEVLIWTKSRKDIMSIWETTGIPAVSLQGESWQAKEKVVNELKSRFRKIFLLYDNDFDGIENWGRFLGNKLSKQFDITQIEIPMAYLCKDYSSLYKKYKTVACKILKNLIK